jgi:type II secretory pathway pseudopilin PulG
MADLHPHQRLQLRHQSRRAIAAFTLVELLIVSVIGGLILAAVARIAVSHIQASGSQLRIQQLRTGWGKLTSFIATEVAEADQITTGTQPATCANMARSTPLFTLRVPLYDLNTPPTVADLQPTAPFIHYYTIGTGADTVIWRCGPPIYGMPVGTDKHRAGQLQPPPASSVASPLISGIGISSSVDTTTNTLTITPTTSIQDAVTPFTVSAGVRLIQ